MERISFFAFASDDAPEHERWVAFPYEMRKKGPARLPIVFPARTKEAALAAGEAWLAAEVERQGRLDRNLVERRERMKALRAARQREGRS
ncbi:hypothetical protein [Chelatococcus sp. XZ-Ab1]|uniref:hypothetical protein n=1 Tax=Chelatococcus sp. XZ-Ab1 TaxID=3034027 RepID=UPI0023E42569|nr:hypothetical protein [Chelatococcus sp. XZ-Ab1]